MKKRQKAVKPAKKKRSGIKSPKWHEDVIKPWAITEIKLDYLDDVIHETMEATRMMAESYKTQKVIKDFIRKRSDNLDKKEFKKMENRHKNELKYLKKGSEIAQGVIKSDFNLFHSMFITMLWSYTEAFITDSLIAWLRYNRDAKKSIEAKKLKGSLIEFEKMDKDGKCQYLIELLEKEIDSPLKQGINRFESLLTVFGLGGSVPKDVSKNIFELNNVRNIILHNGGVVDKKFTKNCPWLGYKVGEDIKISHKDYAKYVHSTRQYVHEISLRLGEYLGICNCRECQTQEK